MKHSRKFTPISQQSLSQPLKWQENQGITLFNFFEVMKDEHTFEPRFSFIRNTL